MGYVGIRDGAIKRAGLVDSELGWPRGTTIGKMVLIWEHVLELELPLVRRKALLGWAGELPVGASDDAFIDALTDPDVEFLVPSTGDRYEVKGAQKELEKIEERREKKSRAGQASQQKQRTCSTGVATPVEPKPGQDQAKNQVREHPQSPPKGGKAPSKRDLKAAGEAAATEVLRELLDGATETEARGAVSARAWEMLSQRGGWTALCREAGAATRSGDWEPFCWRVRKDFAVIAQTSRLSSGPPPRELAEQPPPPQ